MDDLYQSATMHMLNSEKKARQGKVPKRLHELMESAYAKGEYWWVISAGEWARCCARSDERMPVSEIKRVEEQFEIMTVDEMTQKDEEKALQDLIRMMKNGTL